MKIWIDAKVCMGDETCVAICPEVFELHGKTAFAKTKIIPEELQDACLDAAESCPGEAIVLLE
jgi:ferredoxin